MTPSDAVHRAAADGFGRQAEAYGRARPGYHPELVRRLVGRFEPTGPAVEYPVVEVVAGTGIFTAQMVDAGLTVTAVEPVSAMRAAITRSIGAASGRVTVVDATVETLPMADGTMGAVVAAQAFHWFDHLPALAEISRVLAAGGHLATAWNVRDEREPWVAACTEVIERHAGDTPRHRTMHWRRAIDADRRFELVDECSVDNPWPTTAAGVVDRTMSTSFIGALDPARRADVATAIETIVAPLGPRFDYPYRSELQIWRYVGGRSRR